LLNLLEHHKLRFLEVKHQDIVLCVWVDSAFGNRLTPFILQHFKY